MDKDQWPIVLEEQDVVEPEEERVYVSISVDNITLTQSQLLLTYACQVNGGRAGVSVYYDTPIKKD